MLYYARSDTHFLLFVYDHLRNDLFERGNGSDTAIRRVLENSMTTALNVYGTHLQDTSAESLARKWNKALYGKQKFIFEAVYAWRDRVSREEDESTK